MPKRGCGTREAGGVYLTVGMGPFGRPVEDFIVDYPTPIDVTQTPVSAKGMHLVPWKDGKWLLLDWVGESNYPSPADFVEEVRKHGLSRRIASNFPFESLRNKDVTHALIHPRAVNAAPVEVMLPCPQSCPTGNVEHLAGDQRCACWWWVQDTRAQGTPPEEPLAGDAGYTPWEAVSVPLADGFNRYTAFRGYKPLPPRVAALGIFMAFPLAMQSIEVIRHDDEALVQDRVVKAMAAGLSVEVVSE